MIKPLYVFHIVSVDLGPLNLASTVHAKFSMSYCFTVSLRHRRAHSGSESPLAASPRRPQEVAGPGAPRAQFAPAPCSFVWRRATPGTRLSTVLPIPGPQVAKEAAALQLVLVQALPRWAHWGRRPCSWKLWRHPPHAGHCPACAFYCLYCLLGAPSFRQRSL